MTQKHYTMKDLSFRRSFQGAWVVSIGGCGERQYFGYTKREAAQLYLAWANEGVTQ